MPLMKTLSEFATDMSKRGKEVLGEGMRLGTSGVAQYRTLPVWAQLGIPAAGIPLAFGIGDAVSQTMQPRQQGAYEEYMAVQQKYPKVQHRDTYVAGVPLQQQLPYQPQTMIDPVTQAPVQIDVPLPMLDEDQIRSQKNYLEKRIATDLVTYRALEQMTNPPYIPPRGI